MWLVQTVTNLSLRLSSFATGVFFASGFVPFASQSMRNDGLQ